MNKEITTFSVVVIHQKTIDFIHHYHGRNVDDNHFFFQIRLSEPRHYCQPTSYSHPWFTRNELHFFGRWRHTLHSGSSYLVKMRIDMLILSATLLLLCKLPTFVVEILTCLCKSYFKMSGNIAVMITMNKTNGFLMYDRHRNCCNLFIHLTCLKKRLT